MLSAQKTFSVTSDCILSFFPTWKAHTFVKLSIGEEHVLNITKNL